MVQIFLSPKNCAKRAPFIFAKSLTQDHMYMMKIYLPLVKRKRDCFFLQGLFSQIGTDQNVLGYRKLQNSWLYFLENRNKNFKKTFYILCKYRHSSISAVLISGIFPFTVVYNPILFSSPLVLLSNLDLRGFCFRGFSFGSPH